MSKSKSSRAREAEARPARLLEELAALELEPFGPAAVEDVAPRGRVTRPRQTGQVREPLSHCYGACQEKRWTGRDVVDVPAGNLHGTSASTLECASRDQMPDTGEKSTAGQHGDRT